MTSRNTNPCPATGIKIMEGKDMAQTQKIVRRSYARPIYITAITVIMALVLYKNIELYPNQYYGWGGDIKFLVKNISYFWRHLIPWPFGTYDILPYPLAILIFESIYVADMWARTKHTLKIPAR